MCSRLKCILMLLRRDWRRLYLAISSPYFNYNQLNRNWTVINMHRMDSCCIHLFYIILSTIFNRKQGYYVMPWSKEFLKQIFSAIHLGISCLPCIFYSPYYNNYIDIWIFEWLLQYQKTCRSRKISLMCINCRPRSEFRLTTLITLVLVREMSYTHWFCFLRQVTGGTDQRITFSNGRLTVTSPTERKDAGLYMCKATNTQGSILSSPIQISFGCKYTSFITDLRL